MEKLGPIIKSNLTDEEKIATLSSLIQGNINVTDHLGNTLLHKAAYNSGPQLAIWLLKKDGKLICKKNNQGETVLAYAAKFANNSLFNFLITKYPTLLNECNINGANLLHTAVMGANLNIINTTYLKNPAFLYRSNNHGQYPFHYIAHIKNKDTIELIMQWFLRKEVSIHTTTYNQAGYNTLVQIAAAHGNLSLLEILLEHGVDINSPDIWGRHAVDIAAAYDELEALLWLTQHGVDINQPQTNKLGYIPLHVAINEQKNYLAKFLVGIGADINIFDHSGYSAIHWAVIQNNFEITNWLIDEQKISPELPSADEMNNMPMHLAALYGHLEIIKALQARGASLNKPNNMSLLPIFSAIAGDNLEIVQWLVEQGIPVNQTLTSATVIDGKAGLEAIDKNFSTLHYAAALGHKNIFKYLYKHGVNPKAEVKTTFSNGEVFSLLPIHFTLAAEKKIEFITWLMNKSIKHGWLNKEALDSLVYLAILDNQPEVLNLIRTFYPTVLTTPNAQGFYPIHIAAENAIPEMLEWLVKEGININQHADNIRGETPLTRAFFTKSKKTLNSIKQLEGNINYPNKKGEHPIQLAIIRGQPRAQMWLIEQEFNYKTITPKGYYPLHLAIISVQTDLVEELLNYPIVLQLWCTKDKYKNNPFTLAIQYNQAKLVSMLASQENILIDYFKDISQKYPITRGESFYPFTKSATHYGWHPIHYVSIQKLNSINYDFTIIEYLLANGADINQITSDDQKNTLLHLIITKFCEKYSKTLQTDTADTYLELIDYLIAKGANINIKDKFGTLPFDALQSKVFSSIYLFIFFKKITKIINKFKLKLNMSCLINIKFSDCDYLPDIYNFLMQELPTFSPLRSNFFCQAIKLQHIKMLDLLLSSEPIIYNTNELILSAGSIINQTSENGWHPIHYVSEWILGDENIESSCNLLKKLMAHGLNIKLTTSKKESLLHLMINSFIKKIMIFQYDHNKIPIYINFIDFLIEQGADFSIIDITGKDAFYNIFDNILTNKNILTLAENLMFIVNKHSFLIDINFLSTSIQLTNKENCSHLPELLNFLYTYFPEFYCNHVLFNKEFNLSKALKNKNEAAKLKNSILYNYTLSCFSNHETHENIVQISQILEKNKCYYLIFKEYFSHNINSEINKQILNNNSIKYATTEANDIANVSISNILDMLESLAVILAYGPISTNEKFIHFMKNCLFKILECLSISSEKIKTIKILSNFLDNIDSDIFTPKELSELNKYYINFFIQTQNRFPKLTELSFDAFIRSKHQYTCDNEASKISYKYIIFNDMRITNERLKKNIYKIDKKLKISNFFNSSVDTNDINSNKEVISKQLNNRINSNI